MAVTSSPRVFTTVVGERRSEVPRTLAEPVPQALSLLDARAVGQPRGEPDRGLLS